MINQAMQKMGDDKDNLNVLLLLLSYCNFQRKEFLEFKEIWTQIDHDSVTGLENEKLTNLHQKLCEVWKDHLDTINSLNQVELDINEGKEVDLESIYETALRYEKIEPVKAIDYLFMIIERERDWEDRKAIKKCGNVIGDLKDVKLKQALRNKLKKLVY